MGANVWHPTSATPIPAPFRENTLKSFQRAVACGASFLEFDVQVTKDGERESRPLAAALPAADGWFGASCHQLPEVSAAAAAAAAALLACQAVMRFCDGHAMLLPMRTPPLPMRVPHHPAAPCCTSLRRYRTTTPLCPSGVPVIWHDNYVVYGDEAAPTSRLIADLTADEFRRLAPINDLLAEAAANGAPGVLEGGSPLGGSPLGGSPMGGSPMGGSPLGGSPTASSWSLASMESGCTASTASSGRSRLLRKHKNGEPAVACEPTLRSWMCQEEDHFPTLAEVRRLGGLAGCADALCCSAALAGCCGRLPLPPPPPPSLLLCSVAGQLSIAAQLRAGRAPMLPAAHSAQRYTALPRMTCRRCLRPSRRTWRLTLRSRWPRPTTWRSRPRRRCGAGSAAWAKGAGTEQACTRRRT